MPSLPPQTATPRGLQDQPAATADRRQFPDHIDRNADRQPIEQRLKLAGQLAAEILKRYPHLIQQLGSTRDPVPAWAILRTVILRQWDRHPASETVTAEQIHPFTQP
jgi:hypothetical protein